MVPPRTGFLHPRKFLAAACAIAPPHKADVRGIEWSIAQRLAPGCDRRLPCHDGIDCLVAFLRRDAGLLPVRFHFFGFGRAFALGFLSPDSALVVIAANEIGLAFDGLPNERAAKTPHPLSLRAPGRLALVGIHLFTALVAIQFFNHNNFNS